MIPPTERGQEIAGTQMMALTMIRGVLPLRAAGMPWTGRLDDPNADTAIQGMQDRFAGDEHERATVATALGCQGVAALSLALSPGAPADVATVTKWLQDRATAMTHHADQRAAYRSEAVAADVMLALAPEMEPQEGKKPEDAPAAVVALLDDDWWGTLVSLALFAAEMYLNVYGSVEEATAAIDRQVTPLLP